MYIKSFQFTSKTAKNWRTCRQPKTFPIQKHILFDLAQSKEIVANKGDGNNNGSIKSFIFEFVTYVFCKNHPSFTV